MYVKVFSKLFTDYNERMQFMTEYAKVWMNTKMCGLSLIPKE
jgi:hypothetical protein